MGKHFFLTCSLAFLCMISGTLSAAETNYNVLFIQSYTNSSSWHNNLIAGLQDGLKEGGVKANVVIEYLNADFGRLLRSVSSCAAYANVPDSGKRI